MGDTTHIHGAHELHPILSELRDRLKRAPVSCSRWSLRSSGTCSTSLSAR
jgi:hypothetical protein